MTLENSKRLYDHFISIGKTAEAENIAAKHPEVVEKVEKEDPKPVKKKAKA